MRAWIPAVAVALGLGALAASLAGAAVARDRRPPSKPHVSGPLSTTNSAPRYRFSAHDNSTPARRLRFRCAFDSPRLHACARVYGASLTLGEHVLRTTTVADSAFMTFAADGSVWVNRGPGSQTGTVSRIDPATNQVTATVTVSPPGPNAGGCDIGFGFGSIWVVNLQASSRSRIDPATATVLSTISTETGSGSLPCGVAITP